MQPIFYSCIRTISRGHGGKEDANYFIRGIGYIGDDMTARRSSEDEGILWNISWQRVH